MSWAAEIGGATIELRRMEEADATDAELVAILARRADPAVLRIVTLLAVAGGEEHDLRGQLELAEAYVASECTSARRAEARAYGRSTPTTARAPARRPRRRSCGVARTLAAARRDPLPSRARLGPRGGGRALRGALERCLLLGCYDAVLELVPARAGAHGLGHGPRECWLVVAKGSPR